MLQSGLGQLVVDELLYQRGRPPRSRYLFKHALTQGASQVGLPLQLIHRDMVH
jgi:hypothetical protein